tara:strand:+ start:237 stop:1085 length:849 start_codon:yes stop_codon:yes gene_type:complete
MKKLDLADLSITGLTDIQTFSLPVETLFPDFTQIHLEELQRWDPSIVSHGLVHLTVRSWLLRHLDKIILIDGCVGANKERPHHPDWHRRSGLEWLNALSAEGLRPEDIDIVMCTHLHADHVGWNTRLENGVWIPTFPNAQYLCGRLEYDFWLRNYKAFDKHGAFSDSILPIVEKGKMQFVDDGWELSDGLAVQLGSGHTPGHLCLNAKAGAVFCGDVVHSPLQLKFPELSSAFCSNPKAASETRKKLFRRISETHDFLIPAHFPDPGWVKIKKAKVGYETER